VALGLASCAVLGLERLRKVSQSGSSYHIVHALESFGQSTVPGHRSELAFGKIGDVPVVAMLGRFHAYEGYSLDTVVYPIRLMADLGVQDVISASQTVNRFSPPLQY